MTAFIDEFRGQYGVEPICRVLPIAPSTYHARAAVRRDPSLASPRARRDDALRGRIREIWSANRGLCGARKVWHALTQAGLRADLVRVKLGYASPVIRGMWVAGARL